MIEVECGSCRAINDARYDTCWHCFKELALAREVSMDTERTERESESTSTTAPDGTTVESETTEETTTRE